MKNWYRYKITAATAKLAGAVLYFVKPLYFWALFRQYRQKTIQRDLKEGIGPDGRLNHELRYRIGVDPAKEEP